MRRWRRHLVALACLLAAGLVGIAAIVDHQSKRVRVERAEVMEWSCKHRGIRCGGPSSIAIEAGWNARERGYVIAVFVLGTAGVGLLGAGRRQSPR